MRKIREEEWKALRDAAWQWDPIGLGQSAREFADDEYDCIVEQVVPLLQRGAVVSEIIASLDAYFPEHFGLPAQQGAASFAEAALAWWKAVRD